MIKRFKIFEKLGYNEEVSKLTDYVWKKYKEGEREIDLSEYTKNNMSIYVNKLIIEEYNKNSNTLMSAHFNNVLYKNTKNFKISINKKYKPTIYSMEHELKHMYDFIKRGGDYYKIKDKNTLSPFNQMDSTNAYIDCLLTIMYYSEMSEIEAYYQGSIKFFDKNKHKFKNSIAKYLKYSKLYKNYSYIINHPLESLMNEISKEDKNCIMNFYYSIQYDKKFYNLEGFNLKFHKFKQRIKNFFIDIAIFPDKYKQYSDDEIIKFYNKFEKEVENKKKVYLRYIGRLHSYFS